MGQASQAVVNPADYARMHGRRPAGWRDAPPEDVLEPQRRIVDAHHHLWGPPRESYLSAQMLADMRDGHHVVGTVYVECGEGYLSDGPAALRCVGETKFALQAGAPASGLCAAIVGHADLAAGARVAEVLQAHVAAGQGVFRGVRQSSAWHADPEIRTTLRTPPPGLLGSAAFRAGFAQLGPLGLTFDAWVYHTQLDEVAALADAFPGQCIVLDHAGGPIGIGPYAGRRDVVFQAWARSMRALAQRPNLVVKLGGLGMRLGGFGFHTQEAPPDSSALAQAWRPYADTCIQAFGAQRVMFESNFPVDAMSCSYRTLWNAFKRLASGCSDAEKDAMFSGTASRVYGMAP